MRAKEFIKDDWKDVASTAAMFVPGVAPIAKAYNVGKNLYQVGKAAVDYKKADDDLEALYKSSQQPTPQVDTVYTGKNKLEPVDDEPNSSNERQIK